MLGVSPQQDNSHECYDSGLGISFSLMVNATDYDARNAGSIPAYDTKLNVRYCRQARLMFHSRAKRRREGKALVQVLGQSQRLQR